MSDARAMPQVPPEWLALLHSWRHVAFAWTRWENPHDPGGHDHCRLCWACICNHRELFPYEKEEHSRRGCYRHAFYAKDTDDTDIWICRSCFKHVASEAGLIRHRR